MAFLTVRVKGAEGYTRVPLSKDRTVIGRASACDLPIQAQNISREHCAILRKDDGWHVEDLGSSNGTRVNADKLSGPRLLAEKDIIKAGVARITFHAGDVADAEAAVEVRHSDVIEVGGIDSAQPEAAMPCSSCGGWFSTAHHVRGDSAPCPRCGQTHVVV
jgi:pSer/pThr/pTyr-binding forkhead associated (FHA) protein